MSHPVHPPFWTLTQEGSVDDAPLPPPASVVEVVPAFQVHGEHNCGEHRYDLCSTSFKKSLDRQRRDPSTAWNLTCSNCHARVTLNQLHDLPCGDLLCCSCLGAMALKIKRSIDKNRVTVQNSRAEMRDIDLYLTSKPSGLDSQQKKKLYTRYRTLEKKVFSLAGATCCGVRMKLDRFLKCLSPNVSRDLWLAYQWLQDPIDDQRACAWPDCDAYLPSCCRYEMEKTGSYWHWYCVTCEGNSMECDRGLFAAQSRFPWLPEGHPALTPCW